MFRDVYMLHKGIPFRQVEGSKCSVNEKQMQGTHGKSEAVPASDPVEQGCWRASVLGALTFMEKQSPWLALFECTSSCLCWILSKTIKPDPKVHDQDVTVTSHSRTRGPPAAASPSFLEDMLPGSCPSPLLPPVPRMDIPGAGQGQILSVCPCPKVV